MDKRFVNFVVIVKRSLGWLNPSIWVTKQKSKEVQRNLRPLRKPHLPLVETTRNAILSAMNLLKLKPSSNSLPHFNHTHPSLCASAKPVLLSVSTVPSYGPKLIFRYNAHSILLVSSSLPISLTKPNCNGSKDSRTRLSSFIAEQGNIEMSTEAEYLAMDGIVYQKTLRLVECAMFAAVGGLAYFLSNSLSIEVHLILFLRYGDLCLLIRYQNLVIGF